MGIRTRNTNRKEIQMKKKRCKTVVESIEKVKENYSNKKIIKMLRKGIVGKERHEEQKAA
jgi:hypothetical protein